MTALASVHCIAHTTTARMRTLPVDYVGFYLLLHAFGSTCDATYLKAWARTWTVDYTA